jgi:hypothetical protein
MVSLDIHHTSLKNGAPPAPFKKLKRISTAASNGLQTVLDLQVVGETLYLDAAGFPGRSVGLELIPTQDLTRTR